MFELTDIVHPKYKEATVCRILPTDIILPQLLNYTLHDPVVEQIFQQAPQTAV